MTSFSNKDKALIFVPKVMSMISMFCSVCVIRHGLSLHRRGCQILTYHRILIGMSVCDCVLSLCLFLGSWPIPIGTPGVFWAAGTTSTCEVSGFFGQASALSAALYSASLAFYYHMVFVRENPRHEILKMEPFLHAVPLTVGISSGFVGLPLNLYNSATHLCWIMPLPQDCGRNGLACERGERAWIYQWVLMYGEVWCSFILMAICFYLMFRKVRHLEQPTRNIVELGESQGNVTVSTQPTADRLGNRQSFKNRCKACIVARQGLQYIVSFYATWIFATSARVFASITGKNNDTILFLKVTTLPLQGLWNAIIYFRPHYIHWKQLNAAGGRPRETTSGSRHVTSSLWTSVFWIETKLLCCFEWCYLKFFTPSEVIPDEDLGRELNADEHFSTRGISLLVTPAAEEDEVGSEQRSWKDEEELCNALDETSATGIVTKGNSGSHGSPAPPRKQALSWFNLYLGLGSSLDSASDSS